MKLVSWNVNGLRACMGKGFADYFSSCNADVVCLQETKLQPEQADFSPEGWFSYWNSAQKKGYSGTAVFTRREPKCVRYGIGIAEHDTEGRVITLEFEEYFLVNVYAPNSRRELARLGYRMQWEADFRRYLTELDARKPVVCCGDLNVAHNEIDLKNPKTNHFSAGFSDEERACFTALLQAGFTDTFRFLYPDRVTYSWWSYMYHARERNTGWRIDYFIVSDRLRGRLCDALIETEVLGSDHCPIGLIMEDLK